MALLRNLVFAVSFLSGVVYSNVRAFAPAYAPAPSPSTLAPAVAPNYTVTNESDLAALQGIVAQWNWSNKDLFGMLPSWSPDIQNNDPCAGVPWQGIHCHLDPHNSTSMIVVGMTLTNFNINGTLPPTIGDLRNLVYLTVAGNPGLSGPIPLEFGKLLMLAILDLHSNNLNGTIPNNLVRLKQIDLSDNNLVGPIPDNMNVGLQILRLSHNQLNRDIPSSLNTMQFLGTLDLYENAFSGSLPNMRDMISLTSVNVSHNQLSGQIVLDNLAPNIITLDISSNNFTGPIPNFTRLSNSLQQLNFFKNSFSGPLPDLRNMISLTSVNLSHNQLSGNFTILHNLAPSILTMDISSNNFTGPIPNLTSLSSSLQQLDLSNNPLGSSGPLNFQGDGNLKILRLSNISLSLGDLAPTLQSADFEFAVMNKNLETLALDRNNFSGVFHFTLVRAHMTNLKLVNLTSNNITLFDYSKATLYDNWLNGRGKLLAIELEDNPWCKTNILNVNVTNEATFFCSSFPPAVNRSNDYISKIRYHKVIVSTSVTSAVVVALLIAPIIFLVWKTRWEKQRLLLQIQKEFAKNDVQPKLYTYGELRAATNDFHPDMKLGKGAFGVVYKGVQPDGTELAVKQLSSRSQQGIDEFLNEVVLITGVRHRNLVKLKGCCIKDDVRRLLVYEYVENNNLAEVLFGGIGEQDLNWEVRYKMCIGVAQGLHYLHEISQPRIIHRDIKAPNILLDTQMNPKIADFGLARLFPDEESHINTLHIAGTMGYMAPEYASQGQLTEKVDVFSFGVLVLEILSGRKNIDLKLSIEKAYLIEWAWKLYEEGRILDMLDPRMNVNGHEADARSVVNMALLCVQATGPRRPSMARVLSILKQEMDPEVVIRETRYDNEYAAFLAATRSDPHLTNLTDPTSNFETHSLLDSTQSSSTTIERERAPFVASIELTSVQAR